MDPHSEDRGGSDRGEGDERDVRRDAPDEHEQAGDAEDRDAQDRDAQDFERLAARRRPGADIESLLYHARDLVEEARSGHLSAAVKIDRDGLLRLLNEAIDRFPEEIRGARWMLKEREEFLARTHREGDEILAAARGQSERMVQRSEVLRSAEAKARRIVERARADAARVRSECDDYCDQRLAQFEAALERTMTVVAAGRRKLRPSVTRPDSAAYRDPSLHDPTDSSNLTNGQEDDPSGPTMFDQDRA